MDANGKIDLSPVGVNFGKTRAGTVFLEMDAKQPQPTHFQYFLDKHAGRGPQGLLGEIVIKWHPH